MFTARNAIIAAAVFAAATIGFNALKAVRSPDSGGYAADSFGTHWDGYRALFELLSESGTNVERSVGPPKADLPAKTTLVLLVPSADLVSTEPAYLERLLNWVEAGGRIVAAPVFAPRNPFQMPKRKEKKEDKVVTLLDALGVTGVTVEQHDPFEDEEVAANERRRRLRRAFQNTIQDTLNPPTVDFTTVTASLSEKFPLERSRVAHLYLPAEAQRRLKLAKPEKASGLLEARAEGSDEPRILAASFRRGKGEIIVLAEPALLMNMCLAHDDDSVFAYDLLADGGRHVVFDEFYHGSSVRGEPFWLLTQRRYAVGAWLVLAFASLIVWRKSVVLGPPLEMAPVSRRTIMEYVEAMARFFQGARGSRLFVLSEVRAGALRTLGDRLGLSPADSTAENVATALARRSPEDARRFQAAVAQLNAAYDRGPTCSEQDALRALQGISACL
ncbi:MAG TPA: DUF4350 domain-containing protein [Pirellulales bacterium]|jgi:hypothetical protein|nr:DUF4350 domain-containing protein [Pirellulales bacterium]